MIVGLLVLLLMLMILGVLDVFCLDAWRLMMGLMGFELAATRRRFVGDALLMAFNVTQLEILANKRLVASRPRTMKDLLGLVVELVSVQML